MNAKLIGILVESAISLSAGLFLTYLGFFSPVFRKSSEQIAPDRWVGAFRILLRIAGPALCLAAGFKLCIDVHNDTGEGPVAVSQWREFRSPDGRFSVVGPEGFSKDVKDAKYAAVPLKESVFHVKLPTITFLISYIDLPEGLAKGDPEKLLAGELDAPDQAGVSLLEKKPTQFAGYPAIRYKLQHGSFYADGILLLAKVRRYQLVVEFADRTMEQYAEPFFNSFHVLEGP